MKRFVRHWLKKTLRSWCITGE